MTGETAERPTFEQAFDDAVKQHPVSGEAAAEDEGTQADESGDTDGGTQTAEETAAEGQPDETAEDEQLLTDEEVSSLSEDNRKQYKRMQAAFTKKTQAWSKRVKDMEAAEGASQEAVEFVRTLRSDPAAVRQLAEQSGLKLAEQPKEESAATEFALPENLSFLKPVFDPLIGMLKQQESTIAELRVQMKPIQDSTVTAQVQSAMAGMDKRYPEWRKHEAKMVEEAKAFPHPDNMSGADYLERLYRLATYDTQHADQLRKQAEKARKSTAAGDTGGSGVASGNVRPTAPKFKDLDDAVDKAFEAAKAGVRWE
jgi:hypothetical protein